MQNCPSKKQFALSLAIVFIFVFLYDMLVHGYVLMDLYEQTAYIWRPMDQMQALMPWCFGYHFLLAVIVTSMFCKYRSYDAANCATTKTKTSDEDMYCSPRGRGMCYGIHLGLLLGITHAVAYISLPIPSLLAIAWFAAGLFEGIGIGYILSIDWTRKESA